MSSPSLVTGNLPAFRRSVPLTWILLLALAIHGPLLLMQLPNNSYDANLHKFFASHYAQHWFNPWNEKQFTGFSQTTYPPLEHQWIALFSHVLGLNLGYMLVQFIAILLLPIGVYRYARIWVDERSAGYAALGSIFLGALSFLVYEAGQLPTTLSATLYLLALPYFYEWLRKPALGSFLKGLFLILAAASAHHVTLIFGSVLFALPVFATAIVERRREGNDATVVGIVSRGAIFAVLAIAGVAIVLLPFWVALIRHPIKQMPIPHASRSNYLTNLEFGMNYWIVPWGAALLALPFIFIQGVRERRFVPLFLGFWLTLMMALGGTTPLPKLLLGPVFDILTFERFSFWAQIMALPFLGLMATRLIDRYRRVAVIGLAALSCLTMAVAVAWPVYHITHEAPFDVRDAIAFLNRDGHDKYRYLTLGFGDNKMDELSTYADAGCVDGTYNSARLLPELTPYGSAALTNSKYYGTNGMEALRSVLKHADRYGLKYTFVRDPYYEPILAFAGWRKEEVYGRGALELWVKDGVPPAHRTPYGTPPTAVEGLMWGTLPIGSSVIAMLLVLIFPDRRRKSETLQFPLVGEEPILREAR
jgi:6-pyruvoyl-tetrahydropterin synthase related domain